MDDFSPRRRRTRQKTSYIVLVSRISIAAFFALIGLIIFVIILFLWYSRDLPKPGQLANVDLAESTRIYDRNSVLLYDVHDQNKENRIYVNVGDIPKNLQHATVAIEDKNFYTEPGFSSVSYLRVVRDVLLYHRVTGGSGLTQQLVRNTLITNERTLPRKIRELLLAIQVDKTYSKDQILEMYLNDVPYGGNNLGVEAGAEYYFGKHAKELDLAESAFLAGMPQGPSIYSPYTGHPYYVPRTNDVLTQMVKNNYITQKQADAALAEIKTKQFSPKNITMKAPWWTTLIRQKLTDQFGSAMVENGGLQVTTTLDYPLEDKAETIVQDELNKIKNYHVNNGAAIVADPKTGQVLAMVGNKDFTDKDHGGQVNDAVALRQPGSSLKPVMYATAFEKGYTPASMVMDTKTTFPQVGGPDYNPVNYDGKFRGPVQLRFALGNSLNIPAVKMLAKVGIKDTLQTGYQMGITQWQPTDNTLRNIGLSLVLGGRETTLLNEVTAYSVFATGGIKHDPVFILKVTDSHGKVIYQNHQTDGMRVLPAEVSFLISHILLDNNARAEAFGSSSYLVIPGKTVSVKTGTTDNKHDNWTTGYTPSYVVGVWVGNNDNAAMNQAIASGVTGASPIWNKIMSLVLKGKKDEYPTKPDNVVALQIDQLGGGLPKDGQPARSEYFIKGTEPTGPSQIYQKLKISKHQNDKLANSAEISKGDYDEKDYIVLKENDPVSTDGQNRWQQGIDDWIKSKYAADHPEYYPPKDTSDYQGDGEVSATPSPSPTNSPTPTP